jgi:hypothetical protein
MKRFLTDKFASEGDLICHEINGVLTLRKHGASVLPVACILDDFEQVH